MFKERLNPWLADADKVQSFLHIQRYDFAQHEVFGEILDVACGLGYGSKILGSVGEVVSVDVSKDALSYARKNFSGLNCLRLDVQLLSFSDERFDCVVALEVIEHVEDSAQLLREIHRVLKKGGLLIISTPNIKHLMNRIRHPFTKLTKPENPYHKREFTSKDFEFLLERSGFSIEKRFGQVLTMPLVYRLPPRLSVNTGHFFPSLATHVVYKVRKGVGFVLNTTRSHSKE
jgi:SAM-dependent methyltransferase